MEPTTFLLTAAGVVILALVEHNRRLSREIRRNDGMIADLRVAKIQYRDKAEYFSEELKKAKAYIKEFEMDLISYNKAASGRRFRLSGGEQSFDERIKSTQIASETNAAVIKAFELEYKASPIQRKVTRSFEM